MKMIYPVVTVLLFFFSNLICLAEQNVYFKELESPYELISADLVLVNKNQEIIKNLLIHRHQQSDSSATGSKYDLFALINNEYKAKGILYKAKGADSLIYGSIKTQPSDIIKIQDIDREQFKDSKEIEAKIKLQQAENFLEQKKLSQLKQKVSEISRLNRLVQALNTVNSLEKRLAEVRQDREALSSLINMVPTQPLSPRQTIIENQLVIDSKKIIQLHSQQYGSSQARISPEKEQELRAIIEKASKLNVEELRSRLYLLKSESGEIDLNAADSEESENIQSENEDSTDSDEEITGEKGSKSNPL